MLKIQNAQVCDPVNKLSGRYDVTIENGEITNLNEATGKIDEGAIDASDYILTLGLCDVHVHFRDPGQTHKEDIETGAKCAIKGGFTDVVMMANTNPTIDNLETLEYVLNKSKITPLNIHTCASVTKGLKGKELTDMDALYSKGAIGFTDVGIPLMDADLLKEAMIKAKELDVPISLHEEDKSLIKENGLNHGAASDYYGIYGSPREAEAKLIKRDIEIAIETGAKLNIQHISSKEGVELVRKARKRCENVFAEATPHHICLTEEAVIENGANAKMNPPLRTKKDRAAIIEGIKDGSISIIATDHAPHAKEEKDVDILKAPSGIIGLETSFSLCYEALVESKAVTLEKLIEVMAVNPRKLYNLPCDGIKVGAKANLMLFAPWKKYVYDKSESKSVNSPFFGRTLKGKVKATIVEGKVVYEDL